MGPFSGVDFYDLGKEGFNIDPREYGLLFFEKNQRARKSARQ
jgi:hypothetical protein